MDINWFFVIVGNSRKLIKKGQYNIFPINFLRIILKEIPSSNCAALYLIYVRKCQHNEFYDNNIWVLFQA